LLSNSASPEFQRAEFKMPKHFNQKHFNHISIISYFKRLVQNNVVFFSEFLLLRYSVIGTIGSSIFSKRRPNMKKAFASEGPWRTQCWSDIQMFSKEPADMERGDKAETGGTWLCQ
jgi:hypothetical protein